ncbi:hypothetical protein BaRGS_00016038 [Batillaria attramentaria]|uniref:Uncharacterized protein n=1 Tax=Batillaria attramentaria TaxID=370345 RepID=A0ABD0L0C5_9CAEN
MTCRPGQGHKKRNVTACSYNSTIRHNRLTCNDTSLTCAGMFQDVELALILAFSMLTKPLGFCKTSRQELGGDKSHRGAKEITV